MKREAKFTQYTCKYWHVIVPGVKSCTLDIHPLQPWLPFASASISGSFQWSLLYPEISNDPLDSIVFLTHFSQHLYLSLSWLSRNTHETLTAFYPFVRKSIVSKTPWVKLQSIRRYTTFISNCNDITTGLHND